MPLPDNQLLIAEVVVRGTQAAAGSSVTPSINVFHYRRNAVAVPMSKAALNTVFQANILVPILAAANVRYTPNTVSIRMLNDAEDAYADFAAAGAGAIATDSEPSDDAVFIYLKSGLRGKSYQGGKHFGGTSEVDTTGDILTGAGLARWQTVRNALTPNLVDATPNAWTPCIFSRTLSQFRLNPTNIVTADVVTALLDLNIGTMRRRRSCTVR